MSAVGVVNTQKSWKRADISPNLRDRVTYVYGKMVVSTKYNVAILDNYQGQRLSEAIPMA
jgi:hypothetical protein